jgi:hypothetical protein
MQMQRFDRLSYFGLAEVKIWIEIGLCFAWLD